MDEPEGLDCIARIVSAVACPVSADQVAATVAAAAAGAPGAGAAMSPVVHRQNRGGGSSQKIS